MMTDAAKPKSIWDNDLPAGDSPPLPKWPLVAAIVAYGAWMIFLLAMMILRLIAPPTRSHSIRVSLNATSPRLKRPAPNSPRNSIRKRGQVRFVRSTLRAFQAKRT